MNETSTVTILLEWLMYSWPSLITYLIGIIVAAMHLTKSPRPALMALAGCGLCGVAHLAGLLQHVLIRGQLAVPPEATLFLGMISWISSFMYVAGFGLVFVAVFTDRRRPEPPPEIG